MRPAFIICKYQRFDGSFWLANVVALLTGKRHLKRSLIYAFIFKPRTILYKVSNIRLLYPISNCLWYPPINFTLLASHNSLHHSLINTSAKISNYLCFEHTTYLYSCELFPRPTEYQKSRLSNLLKRNLVSMSTCRHNIIQKSRFVQLCYCLTQLSSTSTSAVYVTFWSHCLAWKVLSSTH